VGGFETKTSLILPVSRGFEPFRDIKDVKRGSREPFRDIKDVNKALGSLSGCYSR